MQCPSCGNKNMVHGGGQNGEGPCKAWPRCTRCGDAQKADASDTGGSWKPIRLELGLCDHCAIWEENARNYERKPGDTLIIDGTMYSPAQVVPLGEPDPTPRAQWRGMGGRRFDFEKFDGSPPQSCYSLWHAGAVRPEVRDRMPDNARFLNGAAKQKVGDITCFDPSGE